MRIASIVVMVALAVLSAGTAAQNHSAGYLLCGSSVQLLQANGSVTTLYNNPSYAHGVTMAINNKDVLYANGDLFQYDPSNNAVTTVFQTGLGVDTNVTVDHNGDYIFTGQATGVGYGIFRISGQTMTTITTTLKMNLNGSLTGGLLRDIDTGNYVLQLYGGATSLAIHPMISVAPDGSFTTVIGNVSTLAGPRYEMTQDINTGAFLVGCGGSSASNGFLVLVDRNGMSTIVATHPDLYAFNVLACDRASAASPRLVHPYIGNLYYTDLKTFTTTTVVVNGSSVSPRDIDFYQGRNIQTVLTAPRQYALNFSFPGLAGKSYVAALTLSGVRPGVPLPDGRKVPFNPDNLTVVTIGNLIPGIFNAGPGTLDRSGAAQGFLDVRILPPLGLPVHLIAVVLDPAAPTGFAVIPDPYVMLL